MDEACGGLDAGTSSSAEEAKEHEQSLRDEIRKLRGKIRILKDDRRQFFSGDFVNEIIRCLRNNNHELRSQAESLKKTGDEREAEVIRLEGEEKKVKKKLIAAAEKELNFEPILISLRSSFEALKKKRALLKQPIALLNSWRGVVGPKPDVSWTIERYSYHRLEERAFALRSPGLKCKGFIMVQPTVHRGYVPVFRLFVTFDDDGHEDWRGRPMIFSKTIGKSQSGEEKCDEERLDVAGVVDEGLYHYGVTLEQAPSQLHCASLTIELYFERPWSVREVQSEDGVLLWTVERLREAFRADNAVLYSPYFLVAPTGFRLQAVLYASDGNALNLLLVRRCQYVHDENITDYALSVTVLKPDEARKMTFSRSADLKEGQNFVLGNVNEFFENTFLCKIKVAAQEKDIFIEVPE